MPTNINGDDLTDLLSYNATTGQAVFSVAIDVTGDQTIVKEVNASQGWTSVVPIIINGDGRTDLLSYNATTGQAVFSVTTDVRGIRRSSKRLMHRKGGRRLCRSTWRPATVEPVCFPTMRRRVRLCFRSLPTSRGIRRSSKRLTHRKGGRRLCRSTSDGDSVTDLLSYNVTTGRAVYSVGDPSDIIF